MSHHITPYIIYTYSKHAVHLSAQCAAVDFEKQTHTHTHSNRIYLSSKNAVQSQCMFPTVRCLLLHVWHNVWNVSTPLIRRAENFDFQFWLVHTFCCCLFFFIAKFHDVNKLTLFISAKMIYYRYRFVVARPSATCKLNELEGKILNEHCHWQQQQQVPQHPKRVGGRMCKAIIGKCKYALIYIYEYYNKDCGRRVLESTIHTL